MEATVFSTPKCTWCDKVTRMLTDVEIEVNKIDITESKENYDLMMDMTGNVKTVPQVVLDCNLIGGYTETERFLNNL